MNVISGYKEKSMQIQKTLDNLLMDSYNGQGKSVALAKEIVRECKNIALFSGRRCPDFIHKIITSASLFAEGKECPKNFSAMVYSLMDLRNFDWDSLADERHGFLDFDGLFAKYREEMRLDEAIDKVIKCFEDILYDKDLELDKKTRIDLEHIVGIIRNNKKASDSAIKTAMLSGWEFAKELCPKLKACAKGITFAKALYGALDEVNEKLNQIGAKIHCKLQNEFVSDGFKLPEPEKLALPSADVQKNIGERLDS